MFFDNSQFEKSIQVATVNFLLVEPSNILFEFDQHILNRYQYNSTVMMAFSLFIFNGEYCFLNNIKFHKDKVIFYASRV